MKKVAIITFLTIAIAGCGRESNQADSQQEAAGPGTNVVNQSNQPQAVPGPGDVKPKSLQPTPTPTPVPTPTPTPAGPGIRQGQPQGSIAGLINLDNLGNCVIARQVGISGLVCGLGVNNVTGAPEVSINLAVLQLTEAPICTFQSVGQNASRFTVTSLSPAGVSISPVKDGIDIGGGGGGGCDPCGGYCPVNPPVAPFLGDVALFVCSLSN